MSWGAAKRLLQLRPSLRTNAVLMVFVMLVLPQLIVVGWSLMERDIGGKLQWETRISVEEAATVLELPDDGTVTRRRLDEIAARWGTRVRVIREDGLVAFDADSDRGTDLVHQVGTLFFGPDGAPTLRELDETLGPVTKRAGTSSSKREERVAIVVGVPHRLDSIVRNLVDNVDRFFRTRALTRADVDRFAPEHTPKEGAPRRTNGSGLGLALVKAVAEAHGGEVSASSTPRVGATFASRFRRSLHSRATPLCSHRWQRPRCGVGDKQRV